MSNAANTNYQALMKKALLELREMRTKLTAMENAKTEAIAIIGMGCRFPGGANSPEAFWQLLVNGVDGISEVPADRWSLDTYYDPDPETPGKMYTRHGGFIEHLYDFDPHFFGLSPREAVTLDPQQRLLLEVSWEVLEHAAVSPDRLVGTPTGVFVGICSNDHSQLLLSQDLHEIDAYVGTGNTHSVAAGRLSYLLGLQGPCMAVDTACSSSLVSVHLACQSLRNGECDLALAGGVNRIISPEVTINFCKAKMLAADGRCKTFDASANGYIRGEGCGMVLLKRLSDAVANGDQILAVIRGSAINQDGRSSGLTVPNGPAQQALIRQALENAGIQPSQVSYIEAHGTGTSLGDPIEVGALGAVFDKHHSPENPLMLGSVKTNIGHLEGSAGIAGLIKVVLALQHQEIPPHLHFQQPNPYINWDDLPVSVVTQRTPWSVGDNPRVAGVSSFGFSGTNAHVILAEASGAPVKSAEVTPSHHILTLSAKSETALLQLAQEYKHYLATHPEIDWSDVCFTSQIGRSHFAHRFSLVASSSAQACHQLADFASQQETIGTCQGYVSETIPSKIACLFTGQGSQYVNMGKELYKTQPSFRQALDRCAAILDAYLGKPLLEILYPSDGSNSVIDETAYTQPALFALEYALYQLWQAWGIKPTAVMGHSAGEYVAACVAGVFSLEDGLKLIAARARLMQALPRNGGMLAVMADAAQVKTLIAPYGEKLAIAAINGPQNTVISGHSTAVTAIAEMLTAAGIKAKPLQVSHAFHSPLMQPMLADFAQVAAEITYNLPQINLISNVTGKPVTTEITQPDYWCRHIRQAVEFAAGMTSLQQQGYEIFVEIGPKPLLLGMGRQCLPEGVGLWLPSLRPEQSDWQQLLHSLGKLYVRGSNIDWQGFYQDYSYRRVVLPSYPFQRQRYTVANAKTAPTVNSEPITPILQLLQTGEIQQLTTQLANSFSPTEAQLLPKLLKVLIEQHQQQLAHLSIPDWLYEMAWQPQAVPTNTIPTTPGPWLIFADTKGIAATLAERWQHQGHTCFVVYPGESYLREATTNSWYINPSHPEDYTRLLSEVVSHTNLPLQRVVHMWSLDTAPTQDLSFNTLETSQVQGCGSTLYLVQALITSAVTPRLWIVTQNAISVGQETAPLAVAQAPVWGLGKTIALEHPELWGGLVDVASDTTIETAAQFLALAIASHSEEQHLAFRNGQRYVARLFKRPPTTPQPVTFSSDHTYLVTGGLGGLGLKVAQWLVAQGVRHLVLVGRRGATPAAQSVIERFQASGVEVYVGQADVAQMTATQELLSAITSQMPPLKGIIHAAGVLDDGVLLNQNWQRFQTVMSPKVQGAWNLHVLTQDLPLDFFVCFSSNSALLGSPGQGNYAAANSFLDALAHYRQSQGMAGLSINWGPWAETGMAAQLAHQDQTRWASQGITPLSSQQGLQVLGNLLGQKIAQVGVLPVDWSKFLQTFPGGTELPLLSELAKPFLQATAKRPQLTKQTELLAKLPDASPSDRLQLLTDYLQAKVRTVIRLDSSQTLDPQQSLQELGIDSLMTAELKNRIKAELDIDLPVKKFFEASSIEQLAHVLEAEVGLSGGVKIPSLVPIVRDGDLPLSYAQELAWVMHQLEPRSGVLLLLSRVRLTGDLQIPVLEQSLNEVIRRHESLRTTFAIADNGELRQIINPSLKINLSVIDLRHLPTAEREQEMQQLDAEDAQKPFDLAHEPLVRAKLLQLGEQEYLLLLSLHHIVADIWSLGIFVQELAVIYRAFADGAASPLPELPIQYGDFAVWQRQWLQDDVLQQQLEKWQAQVGRDLPVVELPSDYPRPNVPSFRTAIQFDVLPQEMAVSLKDLSRQEGVTLFMLMTSVFKILLWRYTGQADILLTSAIANRSRAEIEHLIGFFANAIVLRTDLSGNPTFRELLERVRTVTLEAYAYEELPFVKLVEALKVDPKQDPLARVWIDMVSAAVDEIEMPNLKAEFAISNGGFGSKFDLLLAIAEHNKTLHLKWIYSTDLFAESTITRLSAHFQALLADIIANPEQQLEDYSLLTVAEQQQLIGTPENTTSDDEAQLLAQLDELSDEEVNALLNRMLAE
ncbi:SDR family NAD(P)-dependent oxidoreductase [Nostoc sp. UHCC 0702]|nr:SDR family NAD(P)-dependent oxidoreductase [Nostoc sp. UHCC 0702]